MEESVSLRNRWVAIEHRAGRNRECSVGEDAFQERTIDLVETAEEAVVAKTARVTDEVVVRSGVQDRTETIRDTVRKTEVEVDRDDAAVTDHDDADPDLYPTAKATRHGGGMRAAPTRAAVRSFAALSHRVLD